MPLTSRRPKAPKPHKRVFERRGALRPREQRGSQYGAQQRSVLKAVGHSTVWPAFRRGSHGLKERQTVPCGAEHPRGMEAEQPAVAANIPEKRLSELPAAYPGGSKGDRIARTGPTVALPRLKGESAALGSLACAWPFPANAGMGALRGSPRLNGERETADMR